MFDAPAPEPAANDPRLRRAYVALKEARNQLAATVDDLTTALLLGIPLDATAAPLAAIEAAEGYLADARAALGRG